MPERTSAGQSSVARTEACLEAIEAWQPHVNAMVTTTVETARREAAAADKSAADGRWLGVLHGLPMAIKDNIETAGVLTTAGSLFYKDHVPNADAPVVERLRKAGAVIIGKCTMHELAFGIRSYNPVIGQSRNPYDTSRVPGGSSGGSGIVVATGMAEASLGTDTGGSVRLPAAICGITGLRPTSGRVSNRGCVPLSPPHDTIGPMARTALDCARIFAVTAGHDPEDASSKEAPLENFLPRMGDGIKGVRIGVPQNYYLENCSSEVLAAYEASLKVLEKLGAKLVKVRVSGAETAQDHGQVLIYSDAAERFAEQMKQPKLWGAMTLERLSTALAYTSRDYARALRGKEAWQRSLAKVFTEVDILASPTIADEPPLIEDGRSLLKATMSVTKNTYCGAISGIPGLSVPNGASKNGLPLALQLEGAWWSEPLLLRAGHAIQQVTDWHKRRPTLPKAKPASGKKKG